MKSYLYFEKHDKSYELYRGMKDAFGFHIHIWALQEPIAVFREDEIQELKKLLEEK